MENENTQKAAPSITVERIENLIKKVQYHVFEGTTLTVCCLTLENGFTVTGESACVIPENFNIEIGQKLSFEQAREKIWMLEGYLLKQKCHENVHNVQKGD